MATNKADSRSAMFGIHLRMLLRAAKLPQRQLAIKTGINAVTINRIVNGRELPKQATVEKIAHAVPCDRADFLHLFRLAQCVPQAVVSRFVRSSEFAEMCYREAMKE